MTAEAPYPVFQVAGKITARVPASAISEPGRAFAREVLRLARRMLLDPARPTQAGMK